MILKPRRLADPRSHFARIHRQRGFIINPFGFASANAHAVAIYNSLVAWWDFEENDASTAFIDAHGSNDLSVQVGTTPVATSAVTAAGHVGRAAVHTAVADRTAFIPRSNTALDLPNADLSFGGWIANSSSHSGSTRFYMGRIGSSGSTTQMYIALNSATNAVSLVASTDGTATTVLSSGSTQSGSYRLMIGTLDRTNNLIRFRIKGPSDNINVTAAFAGALYTGSTNANFCLNDALSNDNTYFSGDRHMPDGGFDSCFYATRALTSDEFDYLYNAGAGVNYATLAADAGH